MFAPWSKCYKTCNFLYLIKPGRVLSWYSPISCHLYCQGHLVGTNIIPPSCYQPPAIHTVCQQPSIITIHTNHPHQPSVPTIHTKHPHQPSIPTIHTNHPHQPSILPGDPKIVYFFGGFQGEHSCLQNSYVDIFLDSQWKSWLFPINAFKYFLVRI